MTHRFYTGVKEKFFDNYILLMLQKAENLNNIYGQATKGAGRMPWHQEAMKDVVSCDKLWGAAKQA
jgi:hypothetical protein